MDKLITLAQINKKLLVEGVEAGLARSARLRQAVLYDPRLRGSCEINRNKRNIYAKDKVSRSK
jgi:hypothetical protein